MYELCTKHYFSLLLSKLHNINTFRNRQEVKFYVLKYFSTWIICKYLEKLFILNRWIVLKFAVCLFYGLFKEKMNSKVTRRIQNTI